VTGPLIDVGPNTRLHVAGGGSAAYFDQHLYYWQALGQLTFDVSAAGATQSLRLRGAYRQYDPFFVSDNGFVADATGQFVHPNLDAGRTLLFTPWVRYSAIGGSVFTAPFNEEVAPGNYIEGGAKVEIQQQIKSWLTVAANVTLSARGYQTDVVPATTTHRLDLIAVPGASIIFPRVIHGNTDVRIDYNYIKNNSNDNTYDYTDQRVSLTLGARF
jgi:hypothetical protein